MEKKEYRADVAVSNNEARMAQMFLDGTAMQGRLAAISKTAVFPDGMEMGIRCCGSYVGSPSWAEAVLSRSGSEVACTGPAKKFLGTWKITYKGVTYIAEVRRVSKEPEGGSCHVNYQAIPKANRYGKYYPDFDAMAAKASCEEEADYIRSVKEKNERWLHTEGFGELAGFAYPFVYVVQNSCGHYEIYQNPYGGAYSLEGCLQAARETARMECTRCHMGLGADVPLRGREPAVRGT